MKELFVLIAHLLATLVKFARPGGVRAVAAESMTLKHQCLWCSGLGSGRLR
ncbi:MAG: hypothetical protein H0T87_05445 [Gammaproteobacteria bacterium]|nr:hypothetical protein [Gammaproteobacteria bacterium]